MRLVRGEGSGVLERKLFSFGRDFEALVAADIIVRSIRVKETVKVEDVEANEMTQRRLEELQAQLEVCIHAYDQST